MGERRAVGRRRERVLQMLHTLPFAAQDAIRDSYAADPIPDDPPTGPIAPQPFPRRRSAGQLVRDEPTEVIGGYDAGYDDHLVPRFRPVLRPMTAPAPITRALTPVGRLFGLGVDVVRNTFRPPFQLAEYIEQTWFVTKVSALPTALFTIPFGATIALLLAELTRQFGAQSQTGAAACSRSCSRRRRSSPRC